METGYHPPCPSDGAPLCWPRRVPVAAPPDITPALPPPDSARTRVAGGWARSNDHLGAPAAVVDALNGVLTRAHRPQRCVPECGASIPCCPMPSEAGVSSPSLALLRQVTHQSLRTPRGEPLHRSAWSVALVCRCGPACCRRATGRCGFFGRCRCRCRCRGGAGGGRWVGGVHRAGGWGRLRRCGDGGGLGAGSGGLGRGWCVRALCWVGWWGRLLGCGVGEKPGAGRGW